MQQEPTLFTAQNHGLPSGERVTVTARTRDWGAETFYTCSVRQCERKESDDTDGMSERTGSVSECEEKTVSLTDLSEFA